MGFPSLVASECTTEIPSRSRGAKSQIEPAAECRRLVPAPTAINEQKKTFRPDVVLALVLVLRGVLWPAFGFVSFYAVKYTSVV